MAILLGGSYYPFYRYNMVILPDLTTVGIATEMLKPFKTSFPKCAMRHPETIHLT